VAQLWTRVIQIRRFVVARGQAANSNRGNRSLLQKSVLFRSPDAWIRELSEKPQWPWRGCGHPITSLNAPLASPKRPKTGLANLKSGE